MTGLPTALAAPDPDDAPPTTELPQVDTTAATTRVLNEAITDLVRLALDAAYDLGLYVSTITVETWRGPQLSVFLYRRPEGHYPEDLATVGQAYSWLAAVGAGNVHTHITSGPYQTTRAIGQMVHAQAGTFQIEAAVRGPQPEPMPEEAAQQ